MSRQLYHAPAECPVCGDDLITTRKGCLTCGSELVGEFTHCEFCSLDQADLDLLKVFLASRGNVKDVEKHLGVSYPTARARVDAVLNKLGLLPESPQRAADAQPEAASQAQSESGAQAEDSTQTASSSQAQSEPQSQARAASERTNLTPQEQILTRLARGEISKELAEQLLAGLRR